MGEHNLIYDSSRNLVGQFRFGVAWLKDPRLRLGAYDEIDDAERVGYVYDDDANVVAKYSDGVVLNVLGDPIGKIEDGSLVVNGEVVGTYVGSRGAAAAAIALIFNAAGTRGDA